MALLALLLLIPACRNGQEPTLVAEEVLDQVAEANKVAINLKHLVTSAGMRRAEIEADTAFFLEEKATVELRGVKASLFDAVGAVSSVLTSQQGTYYWTSGDMIARIDVVVKNPAEGRTIKTTVLHYEQEADRIWSDAPTEMIEADGTVIKGTSFESNTRMDRVDLTSPEIVRRGARPQPEP